MSFAFSLDGARLWFSVIEGQNTALPPLVLVQGRALDHHGWDSAIGEFGNRTLIVFDHRGTGRSSSEFPLQAWSTADFARDVLAVVDAAGFERAHFYGHSMGGRIVQWLGAGHPDRVFSLVLGAAGIGDKTGPPRPAAGRAALSSGDGAKLAALFYPDSWIAANPETGSVLPSPNSPDAMRKHGDASDLRDGPSPEAIEPPTLVLHGSDDALADPQNAEIFGRRITRVRVKILPGARHAYWVERPEAHAAVVDFLALHDNYSPTTTITGS